jgi:drug/metabolite transporter (DMT)-like permease
VKTLQTSDDLLGPAFVLLWSSGYVVGSVATRDIAPLTVTLWRFVVSAAVLAAIAWWRREHWPRTPRDLALTTGTGVVAFAVQFCALYLALADGTPAATVALFACSSPLLVAVVGAGLGWDRLAGRQWLGVGLGVTGVVVTLSDRLGRPPTLAALGWILLGSGGLAGGSLLQARLLGKGGPTALTAVQVAAGAVVTAVWAPFAGSLAIPAEVSAWASFAWLAVFAGVVGPLMLFALIARHGPTRGTSLLFLVPAVTAMVGWALLREHVGAVAVLGLVVAGVGLRLGRRRTPTARAEVARRPVVVAASSVTRPGELCGQTN